jgi:hypothetical protein
MNKVIIYPMENGGVAIVTPSKDKPIESVAKSDIPHGVSYKIIDMSELPQSREYRDAWEYEE